MKDAHCDMINYSANISLCRPSQEKCMYFQLDLEYIAVIMTMTDPCLRWVSINDVDMNRAMRSPVNDGSGVDVFVARGISNGDMIPGKYDDFHKNAYYLTSGVEVIFYDAEFLIVRIGCTVEWITYDSTTLDPFPMGAIVGGWPQGNHLYLARRYQQYQNPRAHGLDSGYYDKTVGLAHMGWGGANFTMTSVEILGLKDYKTLDCDSRII